MKTITLMSLALSIFYSISSHPVFLMLIILLQTALICVMSWIKLKTSWLAYILFLIFLGGLMVLFIYITSLASNELMNLKTSTFSATYFTIFAIVIFLLFNSNSQQIFSPASFSFKAISYIYSWNTAILIFVTMVYLLLTLIIVVKIANKFEAPIKNMIFM